MEQSGHHENEVTIRIVDDHHLIQQILKAVQSAQNVKLDLILNAVQTLGDNIMTQLSDIQAKADKAFADSAAAHAAAAQAFTDAAAKLDALAQQITDLQAQVAAGGTVSQADLDALQLDVNSQSDAAETAAAASLAASQSLEAKINPPTP